MPLTGQYFTQTENFMPTRAIPAIQVRDSARVTLKHPESLLIILGAALLYVYIFGWRTLDPSNTGWMLSGDPAQHYLGWQFFRNDPWQWPPGRIPSFGIPEGTALAFTDSIPLLALLLKPFSPILPADFQYFGAWMLLCFILNGYFGLRLISRVSERRWLRVIGSCFFVLSPPLLFRGTGHESLMAHWLILAGIEACLARGWHWPRWLALTATAALCHPYLLLMVLGLLAANAAQAWLVERSVSPYRLLCDGAGIGIVVFGLFWIVGYFSGKGGMAADGYGYFSMNILAFFDPIFGSSRFLTQNTFHKHFLPFGQYEGYLYLGAGMIVLGISAIVLQLSAPQPVLHPVLRRHWPLIAVVIVYWLLALSNKVMLGRIRLFTLPLPNELLELLSVFRASGRFGWPLFYLVNLATMAFVIRRLPYRSALIILGGALVLQMADISKLHSVVRAEITTRMALETPLKDQEWDRYAASAEKLVVMPSHQPMEKIYLPFAHLAARHGLATNAAHLARTDGAIARTYSERVAEQLANGVRDPATIYVFPESDGLANIAPGLRTRTLQMDGYHVLPPEAQTLEKLEP